MSHSTRTAAVSAPAPHAFARVRAWFRADARRDGFPPWVADVVAWTPIVGTVVLALIYLIDRPSYYMVLREDFPVEWLQFAALLFTAVLAALTAWRLRHRRGAAIVLVLVAVGALLLAGEEISWAQRALNIATPDRLAGVNEQAETNFHNIEVTGFRLQSVFKGITVLIAVAGVAFAWLTRGPRARLTGPFWGTLAVPTYTMIGSLTMVGYKIASLIAPVSPVVRYQEWAEAALYLSLGATICAISTRSRPATSTDRPALLTLLVVVIITVVLAALTAHHGIVPLNNPEALNR
ncbi:MAG: hypothetical protein L0G22_01210 [Propionibacteriaceae bacterium]|nr:hypothetical protein [Propionibacteriaceae bacterium]